MFILLGVGGLTDKLPTYILFDNASEVARLPEISSHSKYFIPSTTKKKSLQCSRNRLSNDFDHHLGSSSYAQTEYKLKKKLKVDKLTVDQIAKISYGTFNKEYKSETKKNKNLIMVDALTFSVKQATLKLQGFENPDPSKLPQEVQDKCVYSVFGSPKKNRSRLKGTKILRNRKEDDAGSLSSESRIDKRIQEESTVKSLFKKCDKLAIQNQVLMDFFCELHPDKMEALKQRLEYTTVDSSNSQIRQESICSGDDYETVGNEEHVEDLT